MRTTIRAVVLVLALAGMAACGDAGEDEQAPGETSVTSTSVPARTATTAAPPTTAGRTCAAILADGLKLSRDYAQEVRGIAGADEAKYKARAQVLVAEARRLGCPVPPGVDDFLR